MSEPSTISGDQMEDISDTIYHYISPEEEASNRNKKVVRPKPNQLQIDMDSISAKLEFDKRLNQFEFPMDFEIEIHESSPGKFHATLTFENFKFEPFQRVRLESVLGDDPARVYLNAQFLMNGDNDHSCLFEAHDFIAP